jgi:Mn2+/Fe2+ NRAMP family transporter
MIAHATLIPSWPKNHEQWSTLVAILGTFFSNFVMFFIILTTALTLHDNGLTNIESSKQAALALYPLAGKLAATLFTLGIVGVGLLAIPTLTGSAAYALAETFAWREGLDQRFRGARPFYLVIIVSTSVGVAMDRGDQRVARACSSPRNCFGRTRSHADERPAQFDAERRRGLAGNSADVRCGDRHVCVLN